MTLPVHSFSPETPGTSRPRSGFGKGKILGATGFDEDKEKKLACRAPRKLANLAGYRLSANDHVALAA